MSTPNSQKSARGIRELLNQKPPMGRDDPRYWREKIDRWEQGKDRDRRRMDTQQRGDQPLTLKPTSFWEAPQSFWQGPQSFWQEPEPLKDALIAEIVKPLEAEARHYIRSKLEKMWAVQQVQKQQDHVRGVRGFFQDLQYKFENGVIKFGDYLRILKAFYALLKLLDERRLKNKAKKELEQQQWDEQHDASFSEEKEWLAKEVAVLAKIAAGDEGLADQFFKETGMGSADEIELVPGLKIKIKDTSGGDDGGGAADDASPDDSSSESETKKKQDKPKTPQEERSSRKWMALSAKLRAEVSGLDKKEARRIMKEFGKAVAKGDENEARKSLSASKNSTEIWKWAKDMFFKKKAAQRGAIMSDPTETQDQAMIPEMIKELDLIAASLEKDGASAEIIDQVDLQAARLASYYSMEEMDMYDDDEDVVDDSESLEMDYAQPAMQQPMMQQPAPAPAMQQPMMQQPPMGGPMDPGCQAPMLEDQTTMPSPGLQQPSLPDNTSLVDPRMQAPGLGGPTNSTMPVPQSTVPMDEPAALDDDMYGDDEVMDYEEDMMFAEVVASVSKSLEDRGATELAAEVRSLTSEDE